MNPIAHRNHEIERLGRENKALREWIFDTMSTLVSTQNSELGDILTVLNMLSKSAAKVLNSTAHKQVSEHLERELAESLKREAELVAKLDELLHPKDWRDDVQLIREIRQFMKRDQIIYAIKHIRSMYAGVTLTEARDFAKEQAAQANALEPGEA